MDGADGCYVVDSSNSMNGDRISSLKQNLTDSIFALKNHVAFNIVDFGANIDVMQPGNLTRNKDEGKTRVYEMDLSGATRCFCAIRQAMLLDECDTIYFLSDGAPAKDSVSGWPDIMRAVVLMTRYYQTSVFCIDFDPKAGNRESMRQLAQENYGMHESIEVGAADPEFDVGGAKRGKKKKK